MAKTKRAPIKITKRSCYDLAKGATILRHRDQGFRAVRLPDTPDRAFVLAAVKDAFAPPAR